MSTTSGGTQGSASMTSTSSDPTDDGVCTVDADCDDGLYCTGVELCRPEMAGADARGCIGSADPCTAPDVCSEAGEACLVPCEQDSDVDDDGFDSIECGGADCDDTDPDVNPDAVEVCDGVDDDCDPSTLAPADGDMDGAVAADCCNPDGRGGEVCGTDCDDTTPGELLGTWFDCEVCGTSCGEQQACEAGACLAARRVFVTADTFDGNMGGESGADARCQEAAEEAGLGGSWRAYLLQAAGGLDRHTQAAVPHVRLDGVRIADSWADLDSSLAATLNVTPELQTVGGNAWTGMSDFNTVGNVDCNDWSSSAGGCLQGGPCGAAGETNMVDSHWDGWFIFNCTDLYRLYCIEQ